MFHVKSKRLAFDFITFDFITFDDKSWFGVEINHSSSVFVVNGPTSHPINSRGSCYYLAPLKPSCLSLAKFTDQSWIWMLRNRFVFLRRGPHISLFAWKRVLFLRFGLPSTRIRWKRSPKTHLFKNALQSGDFWKRRLFVYVWKDENGQFRIRWCHTCTSYTSSVTHVQ